MQAHLGLVVEMPQGFNLADIPGPWVSGDLASLPKLSKTEILVGNFEGSMSLITTGSHSLNNRVSYVFQNGIQIKSGCVIPATGPLASFVGGKSITAYIEGEINFRTGAFSVVIAAAGRVTVGAGDLSVEGRVLSIAISRGTRKHLTHERIPSIPGLQVALSAEGSVTLPGNFGKANISLTVEYSGRSVRLQAKGKISLFSTLEASIVIDALSNRANTGKKSPTRIAVIAALDNGLKFDQIKYFRDCPGVEHAPHLKPGSSIAWSNFKGNVRDLNADFVTQDLVSMARQLSRRKDMLLGSSDFMQHVDPGLMDMTQSAISELKSALHQPSNYVQTSGEEHQRRRRRKSRPHEPRGRATGNRSSQKKFKRLLDSTRTLPELSMQKALEAGVSVASAQKQFGTNAIYKIAGVHSSAMLAASQTLDVVKLSFERQKLMLQSPTGVPSAISSGTNVNDRALQRLKGGVDDAQRKLEKLFAAANMDVVKQKKFKVGAKMVHMGTRMLHEYQGSLASVKTRAEALLKGVSVPETTATIPAGSVISKVLLGGHKGDVKIKGTLNLKRGQYAFETSLVRISEANEAFVGNGLGSDATLNLKSLKVNFMIDREQKKSAILIDADAIIKILAFPGIGPMSLVIHGSYKTESGLTLSGIAASNTLSGQRISVSLGLKKNAPADTSNANIGVIISLPDGLDLASIKGSLDNSVLSKLPRLTRTLLKFGNFDGNIMMKSGIDDMKADTAFVRNQLEVESGCVVPIEGPLMQILTPKQTAGHNQIVASLKGKINFVRGAYYLNVDIEGKIGISSDRVSLISREISFVVDKWTNVRTATFKLKASMDATLNDVGHCRMHLNAWMSNGVLSIDAIGDINAFGTKSVILFGAKRYKKSSGLRNKLFFVADLREGLKVSNIPSLSQVPGVDAVPVLDAGSSFAYSSSSGLSGEVTKESMRSLVDEMLESTNQLMREVGADFGHSNPQVGCLFLFKVSLIEF